jgi:hypothetical protein
MTAGLRDVDLRVEPGPARGDLLQVRRRVDAALSPGLPLEVLDDVGHVDRAPVNTCALERRVQQLARGPTNGRPSTSSTSPGCSPMSIAFARGSPSPNTVWVPRCHRSHALQPDAASLRLRSVRWSGTNRSAVPARPCPAPGRQILGGASSGAPSPTLETAYNRPPGRAKVGGVRAEDEIQHHFDLV